MPRRAGTIIKGQFIRFARFIDIAEKVVVHPCIPDIDRDIALQFIVEHKVRLGTRAEGDARIGIMPDLVLLEDTLGKVA